MQDDNIKDMNNIIINTTCPPGTDLLEIVLRRQPRQICLALIDPLLLDQLLSVVPIQPVHQLDRTLAHPRNGADIPERLDPAKKVASKVYGASCNRYGTPSVSNSIFASSDNDVPADSLNVRRKIKMIAVSDQEIFWSSSGAGSGRIGRCARGEVKCLLQSFVALSQRLLGDVRQVADFAECTWYMCLTTRNENARRDDSIEGLAAQQFFFIRSLVELFRDVADGFGEGELVAPIGDVSEGSEEIALRTRALGTRGGALQLTGYARATITETDDSVQLLNAFQQWI